MIEGFTGGGFLAENPEAFGLISDATPVATDRIMVAANGYTADDGMQPPTFTVGGAGIEGLYEGLYRTLLSRTYASESILRLIFGESEGRQTHPVARYCAALTEALAFRLLTEDGKDLPLEECVSLLSERLPRGLDGLRDVIRTVMGPRPGGERFFAVSFFACRVNTSGDGEYDLDVFSAGDFSLLLLDERGMSPLWTRETELLSGDETSRVEGYRLHLSHSTPFALILLSRSAREPTLVEQKGLSERPGLIWRHRMRLEDQLARLLGAGIDLSDAAERMKRYFEGRSMDGDSASGGVMILGGPYETVRAMCLERSRYLENLLALFPAGYDPAEGSRETLEGMTTRTYISNAFSTRPGLRERTSEALSKYTRGILQRGADTEASEADDEAIRHLRYRDVAEIFATFDGENTDDRTAIKANSRLLRGLLSEHWVTLRSLLCPRSPASAAGLASLDACVRLKRQITSLTAYRRRLLEGLRDVLSDELDNLCFQKEDWIRGKGGDDSAAAWFGRVGDDLPRRVDEVRRDWDRVSVYLRSLQTAYTQERDKLFASDTDQQNGAWYDEYQKILTGDLPKEKWLAYVQTVSERAPAFGELIRMIMALSDRNGVLIGQIDSRAAERRTLQAISENEMWQVECMLGALSDDPVWGEDCLKAIDSGFRSEYKAFARRLQEEKDLAARRKEAYERYRAVYEAFELGNM